MNREGILLEFEKRKQQESDGIGSQIGGKVQHRDTRRQALARHIEELKAYVESIPDPNEGRIQELRDLIHKGRLATREAIREVAEKLARQFLG